MSVTWTSKFFEEIELIYPGVALYFEVEVFQFDESLEDCSMFILSRDFQLLPPHDAKYCSESIVRLSESNMIILSPELFRDGMAAEINGDNTL